MDYNMKNHTYTGDYKSAIARAKKVLVAAGFPWSVTRGRYSPFGGTQTITRGVRVTRIGYSETISLYVMGYTTLSYSDAARDHDRMVFALAIQALRDAGLPFDDRGWLACGRDAIRAA